MPWNSKHFHLRSNAVASSWLNALGRQWVSEWAMHQKICCDKLFLKFGRNSLITLQVVLKTCLCLINSIKWLWIISEDDFWFISSWTMPPPTVVPTYTVLLYCMMLIGKEIKIITQHHGSTYSIPWLKYLSTFWNILGHTLDLILHLLYHDCQGTKEVLQGWVSDCKPLILYNTV